MTYRNFYTACLYSLQFWATKEKRVSHWLTFLQYFIVPMHSCYIMIAYLPWRNDFLRLTLQMKKNELSVFVVNIFIQVMSWLAAHSHTNLFELNMSNIIQRQHVWKISQICHLKHSLGLQRNRGFLNHQSRLSDYLHTFSRNLSSYTKSTVIFFKRLLLFNLVAQTAFFTDTVVPKWKEILKYYRNTPIYDHTRT